MKVVLARSRLPRPPGIMVFLPSSTMNQEGVLCITRPPSSPMCSMSAAASCTALIAASSTTPSGSSTSVSQERT